MKFLVSGANGFVGKSVVDELRARGHDVTALVRHGSVRDAQIHLEMPTDTSAFGNLPLAGFHAVIHLAGVAHRRGSAPSVYQEVNCDLTVALAEASAAAGVERFVFASTAKVHGDRTDAGSVLTAASPYVPTDPYSQSKIDAEVALLSIHLESGMDIEIIRPPLVVAEHAKGNIALIRKLGSLRLPFPVASVANRRTMISLENLTEKVCALAEQRSSNQYAVNLLGDEPVGSTESLVHSVSPGIRTVRIPSRVIQLVAAVAKNYSSFDLSPLVDDFELEPGRQVIHE